MSFYYQSTYSKLAKKIDFFFNTNCYNCIYINKCESKYITSLCEKMHQECVGGYIISGNNEYITSINQ